MPRFADSGCGPLDLGNASFIADALRALDGEMARSLLGLRLVSENAGWFVPHKHVCWLSSCPALLRTDQEGRLQPLDPESSVPEPLTRTDFSSLILSES